MANDIDFQPGTAHLAACGGFARCQTMIYDGAQIFFQTLTKVLKHGGASAEDDIFVKASTDVDGRLLDDAVHNFGERGEEVRRGDFRVEEDLGARKRSYPTSTEYLRPVTVCSPSKRSKYL